MKVWQITSRHTGGTKYLTDLISPSERLRSNHHGQGLGRPQYQMSVNLPKIISLHYAHILLFCLSFSLHAQVHCWSLPISCWALLSLIEMVQNHSKEMLKEFHALFSVFASQHRFVICEMLNYHNLIVTCFFCLILETTFSLRENTDHMTLTLWC
jgi:hypothetical protein